MKNNKYSISLLTLALLLSSCSPRQFSAVATGSSVGGMFGSSIGGLMGGWRGSNKGTLAGMVIGGAIGVAATAPKHDRSSVSDDPTPKCESDAYSSAQELRRERGYDDDGDSPVQYGTYNQQKYRSHNAAVSDLEGLQVSNIHFLDANDNKCLDKDEEAYIILDIKNRSGKTLYNVTPLITCSNRRVEVSPAATISLLRPDKGVRYKAMVRSVRKLGKTPLDFKVEFSNNEQTVVAGSFKIQRCLT